MNKPRVVLTRYENDLAALREDFPSVEWLEFPLIQFDYRPITSEMLERIRDEVDWLVFTSQNGVRSFFKQCTDVGSAKIACVGPKTAQLVRDLGFSVDFIPSHYTSMVLAKEIPLYSSDNLCYVGGNLSRTETLALLKEKSKQFMQVEAYHTVASLHSIEEWRELFQKKLSIVSFCSPSAVVSSVEQMADCGLTFPNGITYAAIGTTTAAAIREHLGVEALLGDTHTFKGMVEAIILSLNQQANGQNKH